MKRKTRASYHEQQFQTPYRSTIAFCNWLEAIGYIRKDSKLKIMDVGAGQGANIYYMGKRYPKSTFVGADINPELIERGNHFFKKDGVRNCHLVVGDINDPAKKYISEFDGIVSYQTLCWLPEYKKPIAGLAKLKAPWVALTSLFYDGEVACDIKVKEYDLDHQLILENFYNIYSLPIIKGYLQKRGYADFKSIPFEIDIDLPKPKERVMKTYTEKLKNGRRLQRSGPLLMPWYFIGARNAKVVDQ